MPQQSKSRAEITCHVCGAEIQRAVSWDATFGMVVETEECSPGCAQSLSCRWPEDVSQEVRDSLGLVEVREKTHD
jgi:hypothetical protein